MKCYKKFPTSNYFNIDITDVQYLNTLIGKKKGPTTLYLQLTDAETGKAVTLRARDTITVHNALLDFVRQQENWTYSVN